MTIARVVQRVLLVLAVLSVWGWAFSPTPGSGAGLPALTLRVQGAAQEVTVGAQGQFLVTVDGFAPGELVRISASFVTYGGSSIVPSQTVKADAKGHAANVSLYVPPGTRAGAAAVTATGVTSGRQAKGYVKVVYHPTITVTPASVLPNGVIGITGHDFAAYSVVHIRVTTRDTAGRSVVLPVDATVSVTGDFSRAIRIPQNTAPGTYAVDATDTAGGLTATGKITVAAPPPPRATATPTATATPVPHPSVAVLPAVTLPNQNITVVGTGFPANAPITVQSVVQLRTGATRVIGKQGTADRTGRFAVSFRVPYKTAAAMYPVRVYAPGLQTAAQVQVLPLSRHPRNLVFRKISVRYHIVRQGTWDRVTIQASLHTRLGVWVHVVFPSGKHHDFYAETNAKGQWKKRFTVPHGSATSQSHTAVVLVQLWHGNQTVQGAVTFALT